MRLSDLTPPQKKLLRLAGRIEPNSFKIEPGERENIRALVNAGLLAETTIYGRLPAVYITDKGREALR